MSARTSARTTDPSRVNVVCLRLEPLEDRTLLAAAVAPLFLEQQVNVGINHIPSESKPDVGVAADGSFNVAFLQVPPSGGPTRDLYVRRFNSDGTLKPLNTILVASGKIDYPRITVRDDGSFVVGYTFGDVSTVLVNRYAADGTSLGGAIEVAAGIEPDVAVR